MRKKGISELPFLFIPSVILLIVILFVYGIIFFGVGIKKSPNLVIRAEAFQDSLKVLTLLRTPLENNQIAAEAINQAVKDETKKQEVERQLKELLLKIPKPKTREAFWNLEVTVNNQEFFKIEQKTIGAKDFFIQTVNLPLENKELAKVTLSLNCFSCTKEDIEENA